MDDRGDDQDHTPVMSMDDEDAPQPEVARIRRKVRSAGRDGRVRSKTIAPKRLTRDEKRLSELLVYPDDVERPAARHECSQMHREGLSVVAERQPSHLRHKILSLGRYTKRDR